MISAREAAFSKVGVLVVAAHLVVSPCGAQNAGRFAAAGGMTVARSQHAATLLTDGRVLLTGGTAGDAAAHRSTEIFDPSTATFRAGPNMLEARRMHTSTLLADGRVLITGGFVGGVALSSAELYDPITGTFARTGDMIAGRGGHDAILLSNGTVLILGGNGGFWPDIPAAEIYDPPTGTFTRTGGYVGRGACDFCPPSVSLADGRVLFSWRSPGQLYDPRTGKFTETGPLVTAPSTATLLMDGRVLLTGGEDFGRSELASLFDPATAAFKRTGSMAERRVWHSSTLLPDGTVLTVGGETDFCTATWCQFAGTVASAELYDPRKGEFSTAPSMQVARETHTATLLNDGRVLIAGGVGYGGIGIYYGGFVSAELYTPAQPIAAPTLLSVTANDIIWGLLELHCAGLDGDSMVLPQVTVGGHLATVVSLSSADSAGVRIVYVQAPDSFDLNAPTFVQLRYIGRVSNELTFVGSNRRLRWR